jgi:hypothetical protein
MLNDLSSVRVKAMLGSKEREGVRSLQPDGTAKLELRDNTPIDPKEFRVVMVGNPERPVFIDGPLMYEPTIPAEWFKRLAGGCAALSGD